MLIKLASSQDSTKAKPDNRKQQEATHRCIQLRAGEAA